MKDYKTVENILTKNDLKITHSRVLVLSIFLNTRVPLSAEKVIEKLVRSDINNVTIYRTIKSFKDKSIIRQTDLRQSAVFYEITDRHHHHIVCIGCGDIEDLDICVPKIYSQKFLC